MALIGAEYEDPSENEELVSLNLQLRNPLNESFEMEREALEGEGCALEEEGVLYARRGSKHYDDASIQYSRSVGLYNTHFQLWESQIESLMKMEVLDLEFADGILGILREEANKCRERALDSIARTRKSISRIKTWGEFRRRDLM